MERFDLAIVGAGPAGYAAAMRALDFKKKVVLIEMNAIGGGGTANGALSSKTWWEIAREAAQFRQNLQRYQINVPEVDYNQVWLEVAAAIEERRKLLMENLALIQAAPNGHLLRLKRGKATLESANVLSVDCVTGPEKVWAANIIIATGSTPRKLPNIPIDEKIILTSDGIEHLDDFPESMVVLGAGVIGCEYATIFSNFGKTKVHLIDKGDRILPFEDQDVVEAVEENFERQGVIIHRNAQLTRMEIVDEKVEYELTYHDGRVEVFHVEKALVAVGRTPNLSGLGLEELGVKMNGRGILDNQTQTSIPNIYAVGDVTSDIALVNVGELEARYAVERMFGQPERKLTYENISTIMFLNPEVAGVGLNETQARKKGLSYKLATLDYRCIARAVAKRNTRGFIKLLVSNDDDMKVIGMRMVGPHASSAIQAIALLISMDKGIAALAECVHPHPSMTEGVLECTRLLLGKSLLKPEAMQGVITCKTCCNGEYKNILF